MYPLLAATLLVSAGAIGYEILLMRVLSIVQWHHFAWMIISLALLGYGASGTFIALFRSRLLAHFQTAFAGFALLFSVTTVACYALGQRVPFNALEIVWDPAQFAGLALLYLNFLVPFFFAAVCIGLAFTARPDLISRIYFFDLVGAGLGATTIVLVLFLLAPPEAMLVLAALPLAASLVIGLAGRPPLALGVIQGAWIAVLLFGLPQQALGLRVSEFKGLSQALQVVDARVLAVSSSPLGLLTVVDSPTVPIRHAPGLSFTTRHVPPRQLAVFSDADSMSAITRFDGNPESIAFLGDVTAALPFKLLDQPEVLVLGAGGGSDVLLALFHGASRVDAVELNPGMIRLVARDYADFAGHLYDDPRVTVYVDEARGFVARNDDRYDLIQIGLFDSFAASGAGVQALNESYIYTVGAFRDYLGDVRPGGFLAITRWTKLPPRDNLKLFATAVAALRESGVADPGLRLAMIRSWNTATLLVKNGDLTAEDIESIREFAYSRSFDTVWFPGIRPGDANRYNVLERSWFYDGASALLGADAADFMDRYKFETLPATDDRPYFFHFFKWRTLPEILALRSAGGAGLIEWGYLLLVATLVQAIAAGLVLILLPLVRMERNWSAADGARYGSYFLLLGLAFLFIEMAFIQKFILFLSHPLYSVAVVLSGFLVFAGLGSRCSEVLAARIAATGPSPILLAAAAIAVLAVAYLLILPALFGRLVGLDDSWKILVSLLLIAPLAFCMGMPFPLGLRRVAVAAPGFVPWAWGINGFASVISAVLATLLAIDYGFSSVIVLAVILYGIAALLPPRHG